MPRKPGTRRWIKMGVELEGAWTRKSRADVADGVTGAQIKHDGSVKGFARGETGEIVTRPHTILDHLCTDVEKIYPDAVNETCGFHIHASFTMLDYSMLADKDFYVFFRERWRLWGEAWAEKMGGPTAQLFWQRWNGKAVANGRSYCADKQAWVKQLSDPDQQHRYTALNFSAWHKYQTLENRLLPMFPTAEVAISAIREMSDIYDSYLNENDFPEIKLHREFKEDNGKVLEEYTKRIPNLEMWEEHNKVRPLPNLTISNEDYVYIPGVPDKYMLPWRDRLDEEDL